MAPKLIFILNKSFVLYVIFFVRVLLTNSINRLNAIRSNKSMQCFTTTVMAALLAPT